MMDSERLKAYKKEMQTCFRRASRGGYVEWIRMGDLDDGILDLIDRARKEFASPALRWDLFRLCCAIFLKWGKTAMDDDGDTDLVMSHVEEAWGEALGRMPEEEQKKALTWFMKHLDGSVVDFMEDYLYDFMDIHFKTPPLLESKRKFLEQKLKEIRPNGQGTYAASRLKEYLLQILSDEGAPIDEVERYAAQCSEYGIENRMLGIYKERGETAKEMALLERCLEEHSPAVYQRQYEKRLKELYAENGLEKKYKTLLTRMFYEHPDDKEIYKEYKKLFSKEAWQEELDKYVFPNLRGKQEAMPLFAKEKRYDLLMEAAEKAGKFNRYERTLMKFYPERCLALLEKQADDLLERRPDRKGYRWVASILRRMWKYPGGVKRAHEIADRYRKKYPWRYALWDELSGI